MNSSSQRLIINWKVKEKWSVIFSLNKHCKQNNLPKCCFALKILFITHSGLHFFLNFKSIWKNTCGTLVNRKQLLFQDVTLWGSCPSAALRCTCVPVTYCRVKWRILLLVDTINLRLWTSIRLSTMLVCLTIFTIAGISKNVQVIQLHLNLTMHIFSKNMSQWKMFSYFSEPQISLNIWPCKQPPYSKQMTSEGHLKETLKIYTFLFHVCRSLFYFNCKEKHMFSLPWQSSHFGSHPFLHSLWDLNKNQIAPSFPCLQLF